MEVFKSHDIPKFASPEEEIAFLRREVAAREKALALSGIESSREEAAAETIREYKKVDPAAVLPKERIVEKQEADAIVLALRPERHDSVMEELLGILLARGLKNALSVIESMDDPHVADDFHRFLVQYVASVNDIPGLKRDTPLFKALRMKLFEVTFPDGSKESSFREFVSAMEQFYSGMQSVAAERENRAKNYYTLEIALSASSDEVVFYAAVPEGKESLFEKQVLAFFHGAKVREAPDDYNIFADHAAVAGAYGGLDKYEVFPIKTGEDFDHDPMQTILNVFSKLKREGEGAAIQLVISPVSDKVIRGFTAVLDDVRKGLPARKPSEFFSAFDRQFAKQAKDLIFGISKEAPEKEPKKVDELAVASISDKVKSTIVGTNMRVIAAAETKGRAEEIIRDIESAFNQFERVSSNNFSFKKVTDRDMRDFEHEFSFRLWNDKRAVLLNLKELAAVMHFPAGISGAPQLKQAKAGVGPAPLDMGTEGILLGYNHYRGVTTPVHMKREDRMRHFYVIGQTGTGKTSILKNMIAQDIANGDGCCYIDPHGTDIQDILSYVPPERMDDVIYFDPAYTARPMGLNMLEFDPRYPEQKTFVINDMMMIFNQLFDMKVSGGAMFEQYFKNSALLVMEHPESGSTLLEITRVLADKEFRDMKLSHCKNPIIRQFWEGAEKATGDQGLANFVPYVSSKFDPLISNEIMRPVIAQEKSSFNFRRIMDEKKILLANLSKGRLGELNANLIGLILVGKIQMAALSRVDMYGQQMNDFYLYIDEFQNVTTPAIASILSEARKYRLSLNVAHQYIAQLPEDIKGAVFGNVGSMAVFRISPDDAQYLESKFTPTFTAADIVRLENRNAYMSMIINGAPSTKPFNIVTADNPAGDKALVDEIKQRSYMAYGRDRAEVEAEIFGKYSK